METKIYSSSGFSHECSAAELYVLTRHWLSDIRFFEQEISFLQMLINKFFLPKGKHGEINRFQLVDNRLNELRIRKDMLKEDITEHQNKLGLLLDKSDADKQVYLNNLQSKLESQFFDFIKTFRFVKQGLFTACEEAENEKTNRKQSLSPQIS